MNWKAQPLTTYRVIVDLIGATPTATGVQKPLAPSWAECVALIEESRASGIPFMVHETTRFLTSVRKAREIIDSGALGTLTWACIAFRTGHDIYGKQPYLAEEEDHFILLDLGMHMLDVARYPLGEVSKLYCQSQSIKPGIPGEDMATAMLRHASGATSVVETSYASPIHPDPFPKLTLQVEGTRGSLRLDPGYAMSLFSDGAAQQFDVSPQFQPWSASPWHGTQESVLRIQRHWVKSLLDGTEPETSGADSLKTYGLVFGAYESARTGRAVAPLA